MAWLHWLNLVLKNGGDVPAIERFEGDTGRDKTKVILLRNSTVTGDEDIANAFLEVGELVSFKRGEDIVIEGDIEDDSAYFLLSGVADVFVNGKRRDDIQRSPPVTVGEMSALDPNQKRSATVRVTSRQLVALKVSGSDLRSVADGDPWFLKRLNEDIAQRGRQAILATGISRKTSGWRWTIVSLIAGILSALAVYLAKGEDNSFDLINFVLSLVVGLMIFVTVLLADPAYRFFRLGTLCVGALLINEALQWQVRGSFMGIDFQYQLSLAQEAQSVAPILTPLVLGALAAFLFWIDARKSE